MTAARMPAVRTPSTSIAPEPAAGLADVPVSLEGLIRRRVTAVPGLLHDPGMPISPRGPAQVSPSALLRTDAGHRGGSAGGPDVTDRVAVLDVLRRTARPAGSARSGVVGGTIRRAVVTEDGEELRQLTIQELLDGLPPRVRRRLSALPPAMLAQLAALPEDAQRALLALPPATQLDIIEALQRLATPQLGATGEPDQGAMVPVATGGGRPAVDLPADFVDFLLGRVQLPPWLAGLEISMPRPGRGAMMAIEGAPPSLGDLRPPDLSQEGRQQRREAHGDHLASHYEKPTPSGTPVTPSQEVAAFGAKHVEAVKDDSWSSGASDTYGADARSAADLEHQGKVAAAKAKVDLEIGKLPKGRKVRQNNKSKEHLAADKEHASVVANPPDLDAVESAAKQEWLTDLQAMRSAGLTREAIDALVALIDAPELHDILNRNGVVALARVCRQVTPAQVKSLLDACDGKLPATLTDPVAAVLPHSSRPVAAVRC